MIGHRTIAEPVTHLPERIVPSTEYGAAVEIEDASDVIREEVLRNKLFVVAPWRSDTDGQGLRDNILRSIWSAIWIV